MRSIHSSDTHGRRRALITGGLGRIGCAIARRFLRGGVGVAVVDRRDNEASRAALEHAAAQGGGDLRCFVEDLLPPRRLEEAYARWERDGGPFDVLVNNAGRNAFGHVADLTVEDFEAVLALNLTVPFALGRCFARSVRERGDGEREHPRYRIINTASTSGLTAEGNTCAYNSSKGGLVLLTKSLAIDLAPLGVTVNAIAPGYVALHPDDPHFGSEPADVVAEYVRHTPRGRGVGLDELAELVWFLASGAAVGLTGEIIRADGGQLAQAVPVMDIAAEMNQLQKLTRGI